MSPSTYFLDMAAMLGSSAVIILMHTRPQAIPLAMITMRKATHGFPFLSYMSMGLHLAALQATRAPLEKKEECIELSMDPLHKWRLDLNNNT